MIMISSLAFYSFWRPEFTLVMLASAATDFFVAKRMDATSSNARRRLLLGMSLCVNLGLLFYFKYLFFFLDNATTVLGFLGYEVRAPELNIILPLGISFYTFQTISYTVDVYRRHIKAERDFVLYTCFVTFFPQLVAGPILRGEELLFQLDRRPAFRLDTFASGIRRIIFGLFLKVVLADNIAPLVDDGFGQPASSLAALDVWTLAFLFGFQIYFDFSAYSHIAIGSARLMGIHFPENFDFPYLASSPRDFWRRWHISLSSWIRDYLYLPLLGVKVKHRSAGGIGATLHNQQTPARHPVMILFVTWAIMGFWHGASWTFVIWGLYHATMISAYRYTAPLLAGLPEWLRRIGGMAITAPLMMLSWIPFRAQSVGDTFVMFKTVLSPAAYPTLGMRENAYLIAAVLTLACAVTYLLHEKAVHRLRRYPVPLFVMDTVTAAVLIPLVFIFLRPISQFIYFQF
jgi:D-alanyl-lipoteichoic acid acyltransferase DltB (MBOAT superfamily)